MCAYAKGDIVRFLPTGNLFAFSRVREDNASIGFFYSLSDGVAFAFAFADTVLVATAKPTEEDVLVSLREYRARQDRRRRQIMESSGQMDGEAW